MYCPGALPSVDQSAPESVDDSNWLPESSIANSVVPSAEIARASAYPGPLPDCVQLVPESVVYQKPLPQLPTPITLPSPDVTIASRYWLVMPVSCDHVAPESPDR